MRETRPSGSTRGGAPPGPLLLYRPEMGCFLLAGNRADPASPAVRIKLRPSARAEPGG